MRRRVSTGIPAYLTPAASRVAGLRAWQWTLAFLVVAAISIELAVRLGVISRTTLIPISEAVYHAFRLMATASFYTEAVIPSLSAVLIAFVLAAVVGIAAGYMFWRLNLVRRAVDPYLTAYYALPIFALYPILIALWGQGRGPIIALAAIFSVVAVVMNAMNGFDSAPPIVASLAKSLGVRESQYFFKFFFPFALPYILIGLRLAFLYSLLSVLAAEFLLSSSGIGFFIQNAYVRFDLNDMYGGILVIFVIAIAAEKLITFAVRRLTWVGDLA